jgi:hypothetical protein
LLAGSSGAPPFTYGALEVEAAPAARTLLSFAGAFDPEAWAFGWGAWQETRLVGSLLVERAGHAGLLHGPVVVLAAAGAVSAGSPAEAATAADSLNVAARLLADALDLAPRAGIDTLFARPQGLDRIWVRHGFIPVPEAELPQGLRGRPGAGLYGWRGGTALWSTAGRNAVPAGTDR